MPNNKVERGPLNANGTPPKYFNDYSKALAAEVRILLEELGKLRDERKALQYEIAELMAVKSKHGAGGEYAPNWQAKPAEPQEAPPAEEIPPPPAPPAWRVVNIRRPQEKREKRKQIAAGTPGPSHTPLPIAAPAPHQANSTPAWAQWRPNPMMSPLPNQSNSPVSVPQAPPQRRGLFGTPSPPLK